MSGILARAGALWAAKQEFDSAKEGYYQLSNYFKPEYPHFEFQKRRRMRIRTALRRRPRRPIYSRRRYRRRRLTGALVTPRTTRYRKRARTTALAHVGDVVGSGTCKRAVTQVDWVNSGFSSRALYWRDLTANLAKTDASHIDAINRRSRDLLNLRGFKIRYAVTNRCDNPITFRVAVVNPNHGTDIITTDFFRGYKDSRSVDFSTALNGGELCESPINKDKYNVIKEWKIRIKTNDRSTGAFIERTGNNYRYGEMYLKINRQLRFISGTDNVETPLLLVWWADNPFAVGAEEPTPACYIYNFQSIAYFKEPGMK